MSCATHRPAVGNASLQKAIDGYIRGETTAALEEFKRLTGMIAGEELARVYLYMGRCYIDLGRMDAAADSFRMGRAMDGAEPFDEYLQNIKNSFEASPKVIVRAGRVTRAQLAHLFSIYFAEYLSGGKNPPAVYRKPGKRLAEDEIDMIVETGIMPDLPDGRFHGEAFVTREAFYFFSMLVAHKIARIGIERMKTIFPGYYPADDKSEYGEISEVDGNFVSGREVVEILDKIALEAGPR